MNNNYVINYYPGSVGDAFIAHAFPNVRYFHDYIDGVYRSLDEFNLKRADWAKLMSYEDVVRGIEKYKVVSTHRFENFDFKKIPNTQVISIDPTNYEQHIAYRLIEKLKFSIDVKKKQKNQILSCTIDIKRWTKNQIFESDIVISLSDLIQYRNDYFSQWKKDNNLLFLKDLPNEYFIHVEKSLNLTENKVQLQK